MVQTERVRIRRDKGVVGAFELEKWNFKEVWKIANIIKMRGRSSALSGMNGFTIERQY